MEGLSFCAVKCYDLKTNTDVCRLIPINPAGFLILPMGGRGGWMVAEQICPCLRGIPEPPCIYSDQRSGPTSPSYSKLKSNADIPKEREEVEEKRKKEGGGAKSSLRD